MTDDSHRHGHHDSDALLSAYLLDDLPAAEAATLAERLRHDPGLAQRLDRVAAVVTALRTPDAVSPPAGAEQRLRARLDQEWVAQAPVDELRQARRRRSQRFARLGAVAAGLLVVAVLGGTALTLATGGGAGDSATVAGRGLDSGDEATAGDAGAELAQEPTEAEEEAAGAEDSDGLVRDRPVALADPGAVRRRYAPLADQLTVAASERQLRRALRQLPSGVNPEACLDGFAVPTLVRVESVRYQGDLALAFVTPQRAHILAAADCRSLASVPLR